MDLFVIHIHTLFYGQDENFEEYWGEKSVREKMHSVAGYVTILLVAIVFYFFRFAFRIRIVFAAVVALLWVIASYRFPLPFNVQRLQDHHTQTYV